MEKVVVASNRSFCPFLMWDPATGKFRLWYNEGPLEGPFTFIHRDSPDAITWSAPQVLRTDAIGFGTTVVKDGSLYRSVYYRQASGIVDGLRATESADGLAWQEKPPIPLIQREYGHDIVDLWRHPVDGSFHLFTKNHYLNGEPPTFLTVRVTYHSRSVDMQNWTMNRDSAGNPEPVFKPDAADSGKTEFYGCAGPVVINGVMVFFLRVLRDGIGKGIGYTVLAFSRGDGTYFSRSCKPWLVGTPGSYDEAHAWVYGACVKDGTLYLSYAAYEEGHKQGNRHVVVGRMPIEELQIPMSLDNAA